MKANRHDSRKWCREFRANSKFRQASSLQTRNDSLLNSRLPLTRLFSAMLPHPGHFEWESDLSQHADGLNPAMTTAQRAFIEAVHEVRCVVGGSQKEIARKLLISQPTLSAHLKGKRTRYQPEFVKALHGLAEAAAAGRVPLMPLDELEHLRVQAVDSVKLCSRCKMTEEQAAAEQALRARARTALRQVPGRASAAYKLKRIPGRAALGALPVELREVDRQRGSVDDVPWAPLRVLARHIDAGRSGDARTMLQHAGAAAAPIEVADAVAACREAGLDDAAEAILHYAGNREAVDALSIVQALIARQRHSDVDALLRVALER